MQPLEYRTPSIPQPVNFRRWVLPGLTLSILGLLILTEFFGVPKVIGIFKDFKAELSGITKIFLRLHRTAIPLVTYIIAAVLLIILQFTCDPKSLLTLNPLTFLLMIAVVLLYFIGYGAPLLVLFSNLNGPTIIGGP